MPYCTRSRAKKARLLEREHDALGTLQSLSSDGLHAVCPFLTTSDLTHLAMTCRGLRSKVNEYRPTFRVVREERLPTKMVFETSRDRHGVSERWVDYDATLLLLLNPDFPLSFVRL